jgi:hypothetical protein
MSPRLIEAITHDQVLADLARAAEVTAVRQSR